MLTTKNGGALFGKVPGPKQKTMKIRILKDCVAGGKPAKAGSTVTVNEQDAKLLIGMKKAVVAPAKKQVKKVKVKLLQDLGETKIGKEIEVTEAKAARLIAEEKAEPVSGG